MLHSMMPKLFALFAVLSCASVPQSSVASVTEPKTRTIIHQYKSAVTVHILCLTPKPKAGAIGSGVMLTDTRMITAYHVVDEKGCVYYAESMDRVKHVMSLRHESEKLDLAEFVISPPLAPELVSNFDLADAGDAGEKLCVATHFPQASRFCGELSPVRHGESMDLEWFGVVQPGNSGSGVYNEQGQLVAIVTRVRICANGQFCFAYGSSIRKAPWL